jgi:membrane-associated phospholipid phosphatase
MAFARVYIGADYVHDVLAGLPIGATVSSVGFWATRPVLLGQLARAEQSRLVKPPLTVTDTAKLSSRHGIVPPTTGCP